VKRKSVLSIRYKVLPGRRKKLLYYPLFLNNFLPGFLLFNSKPIKAEINTIEAWQENWAINDGYIYNNGEKSMEPDLR